MDWFNDKFLPSLFERTGTGQGKWLTVKQTAECVRRMEPHFTRVNGYQDDGGVHVWYSYFWNGRKVILQYSKLNKCGNIQFYMNEVEQEAARRAREAEKAAEEAAKIERIRSNPARLEKWVARLTGQIHDLEGDLEHGRHELDYLLRYPDSIEDEDDIPYCERYIRETLEKLNAARDKLERLTAAG